MKYVPHIWGHGAPVGYAG